MEAEWIADRAALRWLVHHHPDWTQAELASAVGRSRSWVVKWLPRLNGTASDDLAVLLSHSRARRTPPPSTPNAVVERILAIRDEPPEHLKRVPGPKAILYYLPRDSAAQALGCRCPARPARSGKCSAHMGALNRKCRVAASRCRHVTC